MTDLPFGRGGSPLQNLIARGYKRTKISAIRVADGIDTGDVYLKKNLELDGSASEIFVRAAAIIEDMISEIIINEPTPKPQFGEIIEFKRRQPRESDMKDLSDLEMIYDQIRMLDCEGYPHAFLETTYYKVEFTNASFNQLEKLITANVRIFKK
jgi:methionyl-tRNA formyltransferase